MDTKMKKILLLTIFLLSFCATSFAASWQWIYSTNNTTFSIDTASIIKKENMYTAWLKVVPLEYAQQEINGKKVAFILQRHSYKNTDMGVQAKLLQTVFYDKTKDVIYTDFNQANWEPLIPDSIGELAYKKIVKSYNSKHLQSTIN